MRTRGIIKYMEPILGVSMVVKNIEGAGGRTGTATAFREKNDGYVICTISGAGTVASQMIMDTGYDMGKFEVVGAISKPDYFTLNVASKSPIKSIEDLRAAAQVKPIKNASTGKGAVTHLMSVIALDVMGVPNTFLGGYSAMPDTFAGLIRGDSDFVFSPLANLMQIIGTGDIRCLGIISEKRVPELPDIPSIVELGYPQLTPLGNSRYVVAPPGTPRDRVEVLAKAMEEAMSKPSFILWSQEVKMPAEYSNPEETRKAVAAEVALFTQYKDLLAKAMKD